MPSFMIIIGICWLIRLITYLNEDTNNKTITKYAEPKLPNLKTPIYIAYYVLGLNTSEAICIEDVNEAYYKKLQEASDERKQGKERRFNLETFQGAKYYLIDFCNYAANKN